jgi:two-component system sensor histidine kinase KdpD
MLYLLAVVFVAFRRGLRPAIFTAVVGLLAFDFFLIRPYFTLQLGDTEYLITFVGLITVAVLISLLVARAREHAYAAQAREKETSTLYGLSQDLAVAVDTETIINAVATHIAEIFQWKSAFLLPESNRLAVRGGSPGLNLDADEIAVATWAFQHGAVAGYDTDTLHGSRLRYIPLQSSQGVLGIIGVQPTDPEGVITHEQARILTAFANQAALALERVNLVKRAADAISRQNL